MICSREEAGVLSEDRPEDGGMKAIRYDPTSVHMQSAPIPYPAGIANYSKISSIDFTWEMGQCLRAHSQREEIMCAAGLEFSNYPS